MKFDVENSENKKIEFFKNYSIDSEKNPSEETPKRKLVAIPCFNEESTIGSVILKAKNHSDEVLVVDDGSTDKTAQVAEFAGATVIRHGGNKGYGAAIKTCFDYARGGEFDILTIIDGDGQHDADQIQTVMKPIIENKADISIGSRFIDENKNTIPLYRRFGIWVLTRFTNAGSKVVHHRVKDAQSGFRSYSKNAINCLNPKDSNMGASAEILMHGRKMNLLFHEVPITCRYDENLDRSTKGPVSHGIGVIFSILKYMEIEHSLLFFGIPALILFCGAIFFGTRVFIKYNETGLIPFGPSLLFGIAFLILSVILGMTGLILHAVLNANKRK